MAVHVVVAGNVVDLKKEKKTKEKKTFIFSHSLTYTKIERKIAKSHFIIHDTSSRFYLDMQTLKGTVYNILIKIEPCATISKSKI